MQFQLYFFPSLIGQYMLANLAVKNCPNQYKAKIGFRQLCIKWLVHTLV